MCLPTVSAAKTAQFKSNSAVLLALVYAYTDKGGIMRAWNGFAWNGEGPDSGWICGDAESLGYESEMGCDDDDGDSFYYTPEFEDPNECSAFSVTTTSTYPDATASPSGPLMERRFVALSGIRSSFETSKLYSDTSQTVHCDETGVQRREYRRKAGSGVLLAPSWIETSCFGKSSLMEAPVIPPNTEQQQPACLDSSRLLRHIKPHGSSCHSSHYGTTSTFETSMR
ncbi:hypothetical protein V8E53_008567 [Lactarius tabidus]